METQIRGYAKAMRRDATEAERLIWRHLRGHRFVGMKFRRQHPIGSYIVDFAALKHRIVIEIDGGQHADSRDDEIRDAWLRSAGYRVLRYWNNDVLERTDAILEDIWRKVVCDDAALVR